MMPMPGSSKNRPSNAEEERQRSALWQMSGMGFTLATEILAGAAIGWAMDEWLNTAPTILICGTLAGLLVGMATFIRTALKASKDAAKRSPHFPRRDLSHLDASGDDGDEADSDPPDTKPPTTPSNPFPL